jgi:hypothetical protein
MEEHRLRSFENRVLGRIFGRKREEVAEAGEDSRRMRWTGHVARMGEMRNAYSISFGKRKLRDHSKI